MPTGLRILALTTSPAYGALPAGVTLRSIAPEDRHALAALYRDSYPPEVGAASLQEALDEIDMTFAGEFGELRTEASLLALADGSPAGAVLVTTHSIWDAELRGPFVIDLFVDPGSRGRGIGKALMVGAINACRAHVDATLSLRVGDGTSPAAHSLYDSLGFSAPA